MKKKTKIIILLIIVSIISIFSVKMILDYKNNKSNNNVPGEKEPYKKKKKLKDNYGNENEVELKYDDYVVASGYAGAGDNVYYTRNHNLYHLRLSTNESIKIAEGVKKLEESIDTVKAYKDNNFKLINEDDYVTFVD